MRVAVCPLCERLHSQSGVALDLASGRVTWNDGSMRLQNMQAKLFALLLRRAGSAVRVEALLDAQYADDPAGGPDGARSTLHAHICRIRKQMRETHFPGELRTHFRVAYELIVHSAAVAADQPAEAGHV